MKVNTEKLGSSIDYFNKCRDSLKRLVKKLENAREKLPIEDEGCNICTSAINKCRTAADVTAQSLNRISGALAQATNDLETAEATNKTIGFSTGSVVNVSGGSVNSSATDYVDMEEIEEPELKNDKKLDRQIQKVIKILYGENIEIDDERKQIITDKVKEINDTGVLDGLDKAIANMIIAQVIKAYFDDKIEAIEIDKEQLEAYMKTQPAIQIYLKIDELIKNGFITKEQAREIIKDINIYYTDDEFKEAYIEAGGKETDITKVKYFYDEKDGTLHIRSDITDEEITNIILNVKFDAIINELEILIKNDTITKEQVRRIMDENVNIYGSDEEFMEAYKKAGGTEENISNIKFFYDKENKIIHIRKDATAKDISDVIIYESGDMIITDHKTGKPMYYKDVIDISEATKEEVPEVKTAENQDELNNY